jgi:hypothetical protein
MLEGLILTPKYGRITNMERPTICCIEWRDPDSKGGWVPHKDVASEPGETVVSIGLLAHEDDEKIILCMDWAKDGDTNTRGRIYKALVLKRKDIKLPAGIWKELKTKKKEVPDG